MLNWKGPGTYPDSSKLFIRFLKIIALVYIYQLVKFGDLLSCSSKNIFKNILSHQGCPLLFYEKKLGYLGEIKRYFYIF